VITTLKERFKPKNAEVRGTEQCVNTRGGNTERRRKNEESISVKKGKTDPIVHIKRESCIVRKPRKKR